MKKLFTTILMLFSVLAFSQEKEAARALRVVNYTPCVQYFVVIGVEKCLCKSSEPIEHAISPLIGIEPAISLTEPTYLDLSPAYLFNADIYIVQVRIRDGYYCGSAGPAGQPCSGVPLTYTYKAMGKECILCPNDKITLATWKPGNCKNSATLIFTNQ